MVASEVNDQTIGRCSLQEWMLQDYLDFFVQRTGLIETGVQCLCLNVSIRILFLHYLDDLPTLKRLIKAAF